MMKKVLAGTMVAAMVLSLAACGTTPAPETQAPETDAQETEAPDTEADETEAPAAAEGIPSYTELNLDDYTDYTASIKFVHHKTDREGDGTMAAYIAAFNEKFPNIKVETEAITDYAETSLLYLSTAATTNWGDVMFIPAVDKAEYPTFFMPLDTIENISSELNFCEDHAYDGMAYGIPYMGGASGLLYNKAVFEAAGITELPTTPTEFLADLQLIKDNTDAIPLYTNYAAGWTMGAWDAYIGTVATGDNTYMNQKFAYTADPFSDNGEDSGAYNVYRILYDAVKDGLIEDDYTTTDWEGCKGMMNRGEIGTMVLGSWAYAQMQQAGDKPEDIGYMPFPISIDGKQYVPASGDYNYAVNAYATDENKLAGLIFVKWMVEESGWCFDEGGYSIVKGGEQPDLYAAFDGCEVLADAPALDGQTDDLNNINSESELSFNAGGNQKVQDIVVAAANDSESLDDIMAEWTKKWNDAQEELGFEVKY